MPAQQGYTTAGDAWSQEHVAGYAFTNVAIFNPILSSASVTDALVANSSVMDLCGTYSELAANPAVNDANGT